MIFRDIDGNGIRIPNDRLCGIMRKDKCLLWCAGDQEDGKVVLYEVSDSTFEVCMRLLDDVAQDGWCTQRKKPEQAEVDGGI